MKSTNERMSIMRIKGPRTEPWGRSGPSLAYRDEMLTVTQESEPGEDSSRDRESWGEKAVWDAVSNADWTWPTLRERVPKPDWKHSWRLWVNKYVWSWAETIFSSSFNRNRGLVCNWPCQRGRGRVSVGQGWQVQFLIMILQKWF